MAGNHTQTINFNKHYLTDVGLIQLSNTSIYKRGKIFVLSPSIQNKHSWFDLRKVNLDKFDKDVNQGYLLIRFHEKFLVCDLIEFVNRMVNEENSVETKVSGIHWKFNVFKEYNNFIVKNMTDKRQITVKEILPTEIKSELKII